ncbi:hypothetical protein KIH39_26420 [Telmatocola sphagniphila]|uniref:Uncharacterized protein n=1 Tax=Telmatocola sphagniphila TaxID=1123043 RepID=A0A8E6B560_9BACT|nr:hypothetical protein [Telmatocola sphagniphila]QVL32325.1 hypothetical protein KIH39_26420 [Telmatocola sphagniphila]
MSQANLFDEPEEERSPAEDAIPARPPLNFDGLLVETRRKFEAAHSTFDDQVRAALKQLTLAAGRGMANLEYLRWFNGELPWVPRRFLSIDEAARCFLRLSRDGHVYQSQVARKNEYVWYLAGIEPDPIEDEPSQVPIAEEEIIPF